MDQFLKKEILENEKRKKGNGAGERKPGLGKHMKSGRNHQKREEREEGANWLKKKIYTLAPRADQKKNNV